MCSTADLEQATNAGKAGVVSDPAMIGFVLFNKDGVVVACWMSSEGPMA
jgi:hypothetical protein